jgi:hypothetical protein
MIAVTIGLDNRRKRGRKMIARDIPPAGGLPGLGGVMSSQVVTYTADDGEPVMLEIEPAQGFAPAGPGEVLGRVREAIAPAVEAAKAVLDKVKEIGPDEVEVKFGVKASGQANWLVAKAAGEGNFEVTLTWSRREQNDAGEHTDRTRGQ